MIQLQRKYRLDSDGVEENLDAGHVKSYEQYLVLAEIPRVDGVANRIVDALVQRVGHRPLSVDDIASDVRLTRRTLQRRLQEQNANFAQLRDSVRFHYAIKFLIDDHLSVDAVSKALDFSDRTSFTNAFKRWTGLSPSLFRKLFRDYA